MDFWELFANARSLLFFIFGARVLLFAAIFSSVKTSKKDLHCYQG